VANADAWSPLVRSVALQADGKVLIGGRFTSVNGTKLNRLARLHGQAGGTVEFVSAHQTLSVSSGDGTIRLRRHGALEAAASVNVELVSGTGTPGVAALLADQTVHFPPGEPEQDLILALSPDAQTEGDAAFTLTLANPVGGILLGTQRTATVVMEGEAVPVRLAFTAVERLDEGRLRLVLSAPTGTACRLERATDSLAGLWTTVATNVAAENVCEFVIELASGAGSGLFRASADTTSP
jgi:hypothetical protein